MDRNNMRSSYNGPRSLPHMGSKRHTNGHNGHNPRLSPPALNTQMTRHTDHHVNHHDDVINYIYESWNKVTRELERGSQDARYYQEVVAPRQLANFRPFNFDDWWGRRKLQSINRQNHKST